MYERVPAGRDAQNARPGDFILCHRKGLASWLIRVGERVRFRSGSNWSHAAFVESRETVIEALTRGVTRTPLAHYRNIEYVIVRTGLTGDDQAQAVHFARSCLGERYGWLTVLGLALTMFTPQPCSFVAGRTAICSGLVAQAQVRGWKVFSVDPATLTPAQLALEYAAPTQ